MLLDAGEGRFKGAPLAAAPAELRDAVRQQTFRPGYSLGAALDALPRVTLAADVRLGEADGHAQPAAPGPLRCG
jgi:hypothetical protein